MDKKEVFTEMNKAALLEFYDSFYEDLFLYGFKLSQSKELTEDCVHDIFLELWEKGKNLADVSNKKAYLLKYLRRKIFLKMKTLHSETDLDIVKEIKFGLSLSIEAMMIRNQTNHEVSQRLNLAIQGLTNRQKEILFLKFQNGLNYEEIAEITQLSLRRIYNLIHESISSLKKYFNSITISFILMIQSVFYLF
ncbi:MAG: sigma-70 family RNA polymerase sigma factor [Flammeovirgaceae bacterium]|nr:sigma-70 family RNA polymerase sigma factor [Flammeovirgaceae bacterium]